MSEAAESLPPPPAGLLAGRYEVVKKLAQGGMGEVFHVRERGTGRELALKRLMHVAERPKALFQAEYHALARLRHPYIVEVYEFGLDHEQPFYTMELLGGEDLRECGRLPVEEACRCLRDVATSLAMLHAQRLVHRDVSPRNVRRTPSGHAKLFDFGTMVPFGIPPNVAGTSPFISPEAAEGGPLDQRADLYSLGALAYFLLSGQLHAAPRPLEKRVVERVMPARLTRLVPGSSPGLDDLVMSLLEPDPSRRPWSAHEVIAQLNALAQLPPDDAAQLAQAQLGSSRMVGRARELGQIGRALGRALTYEGSSLLVEGPPGVGKSRLLQELGWLAQTRGFCVVRGFGVHGEGSLGLVSQLYTQLERAAPEALSRLTEGERSSLAALAPERPRPSSPDSQEARAALQWALSAYVRAATRERPVLVLIDDLDRADEFSTAFVVALACIAATRPLLIAASITQQFSARHGEQLARLAREARLMPLGPLGPHETRALVADVLGRPPHYARYADYVYREAHGNPGTTLELTALLVKRGLIGYAHGRFLLPEGEIREPLPALELGRERLRSLGLPERAIAVLEVLALCRSGGTLPLCLAASGLDEQGVLEALDELVRAGIVVGAGDRYAFAQASLRSALVDTLPKERAAEIHASLAAALLSGGDASPALRLEAGYHLLHTPRELEGARLIAEVCPPMIEGSADASSALAALARTVEVFDRHPGTHTDLLRTLTVLGRASYLYDYRLLLRYGERTVAALTRWNGLSVLARVRPFLGATLTLLLSMCVVLVRRAFRPRADRGPGPFESLQLFGRALVSYLGVRSLSLDVPGVRALLGYLDVYRGGPWPTSAHTVYLCCRTFYLQILGRELELQRTSKAARRALERDRLIGLTEDQRRDLRVGLMLSAGINASYRTGTEALGIADELEGLGTAIARAASYRVRFCYYQFRGMRDKAERFRRKLDVHGIQGGTTWQLEWFATPLIGMSSVEYRDLVGATEARERLSKLCEELPALRPMLHVVHMGHDLLVGDYAAAIAKGGRLSQEIRPHTLCGWGSLNAFYASALSAVGRHADARAVCSEALAALKPGEDAYVLMYGPLQRALASAYAGLGDGARAMELSDAQLARLEDADEHALVAHALAHRLGLARQLGRHEDFARTLTRMRAAAERSGSRTVIQEAAAVARAASRATDELLALAAPALHDAVPSTQLEHVKSDSDRSATPQHGLGVSRRRSLLRRVMTHAGARAAALYGRPADDGTPRLLGRAGDAHDALAARAVGEFWAQLGERGPEAPLPPPLPALVADGLSLTLLPVQSSDVRDPAAVLCLFCDVGSAVTPPPITWLSELAHAAHGPATASDARELSRERPRPLGDEDTYDL